MEKGASQRQIYTNYGIVNGSEWCVGVPRGGGGGGGKNVVYIPPHWLESTVPFLKLSSNFIRDFFFNF